MTRIEIAFSALNIWPKISRRTTARWDFASNKKSKEEKKIDEAVALLVRRGKWGKKIFKCWTCDEYGHYTSKFPKREIKYKWNHKPRKDRDCLYANEDNDFNEQALNARSDEGMFLGYSLKIKAYRCYNQRTKTIMESANVRIDDKFRVQERIVDYNSNDDVVTKPRNNEVFLETNNDLQNEGEKR